MALKATIYKWCRKCGAQQLSDDFIYQPCEKCAPPGPKSPPRRVNPNDAIIVTESFDTATKGATQ
jgi:hypothetical protein